jgi:hypothetical protein
MSDETPPAYTPRCMNLCCKSMAVYGEDFESDPDYQAGLVDFWCAQTSKGQGPDGDAVTLELCRNRERSCYQEY